MTVDSYMSLRRQLVCEGASGYLPLSLPFGRHKHGTAPKPITVDDTTPAEMKHLRMIFSAPMEISSERSSADYGFQLTAMVRAAFLLCLRR